MNEDFLIALMGSQVLVFGFGCSWLAAQKGRDFVTWFFMGCIFSFFALIILGFSPSLTTEKTENPKKNIDSHPLKRVQPNSTFSAIQLPLMKKCPDCAEEIKIEARKCRYCGTTFTDAELEVHLAVQRKKKEAVEEARKLELEEANKRRTQQLAESAEALKRRKQRLAESGEGLRLAIEASDVAQVEEMLSLGANPNSLLDGKPALLCAIQKDNLEIVTALIEAGANVSSTRGLLHAAVKARSVDVTKLLLVNGANVDEKNLFGSTALRLAEKIKPKNDDLVSTLKTAPLRFNCPKCKTPFEISQDFRGKQGTCRSCNSRVQVPK